MLSMNLRDEVAKALSVEWAEFEQHHPRLAKVIGRDLLLERASESIAESEAFREAMERAAAAGTAAETIQGILRPLVKRFVSSLL